jgi:DNA repair exonuclease SbcCD nuclease subunit
MAPRPSPQSDRDLVAVHSSDLHIDDVANRPDASDGLDMLTAVLAAGHRHQADVVLLAGDIFESHRLPPSLIERTAAVFADSQLAIAILPGNHDPVIPEAVYHHRFLREIDNLHILGVTCPDALLFSNLDLEIWGRPHLGYGDMLPFERVRPRRTRWQIAIGHGHYESAPDLTRHPRPSWLISDAHLAGTAADYIALGHWNRAAKIGQPVTAYYSGSPDYTGSVNVVRLRANGEALVAREPVPGLGLPSKRAAADADQIAVR